MQSARLGESTQVLTLQGDHVHVSKLGQERTIILPLFHAMTMEEQDRVADSLRRAWPNHTPSWTRRKRSRYRSTIASKLRSSSTR